jgi:myo-inositol 2-dehydrogenase / D-chiro-inositol 1-dehydrogenase
VRVSFSSTQFGTDGWFNVSESVFGSKGHAEAPYSGPVRIVGENAWDWKDNNSQASTGTSTFAANGAFSDNLAFADREKDKSFIESITSGKFHNQAAEGVETALSCMLGRMAGETGREVTWDEQLMHGEEYAMKIDMSQFR